MWWRLTAEVNHGISPAHIPGGGYNPDTENYLLPSAGALGNTPLGEVADTCSLAMAKLLVDAGANPTIEGWMQLTALDKAARRRRDDGPKVYELLSQAARRRR